MIDIDGAYGEGGGQILRTAVSLSALTMKPVRVYNIRAGRTPPGLKKQHMAGIRIVGELVDAQIDGLEEGSTEIVFQPRARRGGTFRHDVGTAGSIGLVLQAVIPAAMLAPDNITLDLIGGTDVAWSPPIDYMRYVFAPVVRQMGVHLEIEVMRRGHYPRGGGRVRCSIRRPDELVPSVMDRLGRIERVEGISHCVKLPAHVARRQAEAAARVLRVNGVDRVDIRVETYEKKSDPHRGPGSGIVLWAVDDSGHILGADSLGERNKSAESVGQEAAEKLTRYIARGRALDPNLGDMIVPYIALASGESAVSVAEVTSHLRTNVWATNRILGVNIKLDEFDDGTGRLMVRGVGLRSLPR